jgi:hypothetical protein
MQGSSLRWGSSMFLQANFIYTGADNMADKTGDGLQNELSVFLQPVEVSSLSKLIQS